MAIQLANDYQKIITKKIKDAVKEECLMKDKVDTGIIDDVTNQWHLKVDLNSMLEKK